MVIDGALESNGMVGWKQHLSEAQADEIRGYVSGEATALKKSVGRALQNQSRRNPLRLSSEARGGVPVFRDAITPHTGLSNNRGGPPWESRSHCRRK
ncbi:hypothetical protein ACFSTD_22935 [Novosphingobium colocasiae]